MAIIMKNIGNKPLKADKKDVPNPDSPVRKKLWEMVKRGKVKKV